MIYQDSFKLTINLSKTINKEYEDLLINNVKTIHIFRSILIEKEKINNRNIKREKNTINENYSRTNKWWRKPKVQRKFGKLKNK